MIIPTTPCTRMFWVVRGRFVEDLEDGKRRYADPLRRALEEWSVAALKSSSQRQARGAHQATPAQQRGAGANLRQTGKQAATPAPAAASQQIPPPPLSDINYRIIFADFLMLLSAHQSFLAALKERLARSWSASSAIGDVLLAHLPALRAHQDHAHNLATALDTLTACAKTAPALLALMATSPSAGGSSNSSPVPLGAPGIQLALGELLRRPIEHLSALVLQFERLEAATPPAHPDHRPVAEAFSQIDALRRAMHKMEIRVTRSERAAPWLAKITGVPANLATGGCSSDARALQLRPQGTTWVPSRVVHLFVFQAELVLAVVIPRWRQLGSIRDDQLIFDCAVPLRRVTVRAGPGSFPQSLARSNYLARRF
jgi:hypothetical protein